VREPAKTAAAARSRYIRFLQLPLSCLTKAIWVVGESPEGGDDSSLLASEDPIRLKREDGLSLLFSPSQRFDLIPDEREGFEGEWKARTLAYIYEVRVEGEDEPQLLGWHWHPLETPHRAEPHVHVRVEHESLGVPLPKLHLPAGRVAFEELVLLLIRDLGVRPARDDWEAIIEDTWGRFRAFRTWG
jgi:hypothetical protein